MTIAAQHVAQPEQSMRVEVGGMSPATMTADERREDLFRRVESIADTLRSSEAEGSRLGRLADATVAALRSSGLVALKCPLEVGGFEAEPALQYEVFERVALVNPSAAWCLFIHADVLGMVTSGWPDDVLDAVFADDPMPLICGGGGLKMLPLTKADGGYRISGSSRYGSGMTQAKWVLLLGAVKDSSEPPFGCLLPKNHVQVFEDTWDMSGMRATGSVDYRVDDVLVPEAFAKSAARPPLRGGRMYRTGQMGYVGHSIPAVAWGIVGRALDAIAEDAAGLSRGYRSSSRLCDRQVFTRFIGEAAQKRRAARALMTADGEELMAAVDAGVDLLPREAATRSAGAWATRLAVEVMTDLVRHAGGSVLRTGSLYEQALRDISVVASHIVVDESAHENLAAALLGHADANLMA